jgi:hypothetical protein
MKKTLEVQHESLIAVEVLDMLREWETGQNSQPGSGNKPCEMQLEAQTAVERHSACVF